MSLNVTQGGVDGTELASDLKPFSTPAIQPPLPLPPPTLPPLTRPRSLFSSAEDEFSSEWLYDMLADQWSRWLPTDALTDMRRVGSYSMLLEPVRARAIRAPAPTLVRSTCLTPCEPDTGPARNFA